jgi:endogenous inhibitor of DNA gyrase (YacG/DUF329 family)
MARAVALFGGLSLARKKTTDETRGKDERHAPAKVARLVRCPTCSKRMVYDVSDPNRPFCSPYCKDQDIINWAEQRYFIKGPVADEDGREAESSSGEDDESP